MRSTRRSGWLMGGAVLAAVLGGCSGDAVDPFVKAQFDDMSPTQVELLGDGVVSVADLQVVLNEERACLEREGGDVTAAPPGEIGWQVSFSADHQGDTDLAVDRCHRLVSPLDAVFVLQNQLDDDEKEAAREKAARCLRTAGVDVAVDATAQQLFEAAAPFISKDRQLDNGSGSDAVFTCLGPLQSSEILPLQGVDQALADWLDGR